MCQNIFFSMSDISASESVFLTRLLMLGILFSTAVNAEVAAKLSLLFSIIYLLLSPLISGIFLTTSLTFFSIPNLSVPYLGFNTNQLLSITFTFVTTLSDTVF